MKKLYLGLIFIALFGTLQAQVTITSSDMPVSGDMISMRTTNSVNGLNYTNTGSNFVWDFSTLTGTADVIDTFMNVSSTTVSYYTFFFLLADQTHKATVAQKQSIPSIPGVPISDGYSFQKNSNSEYSEVGVGLTISGIAVPLKFDNPDVRYKFPITYGTTDSTDSKYSASVPGLGYYGEKRHRANFVDGWGVLYLPYDTFNVIRVKSTVQNIDSLYLDTISMPFKIPRNVTEYKWLTPGHHLPVLQIDNNGLTISVRYFSSKPIGYGISDIYNSDAFSIFPNPTTDILTVILMDYAAENQISIADISGKEVYRKIFTNEYKMDIPVNNLAKGLYFIRISNSQKSYCQKFVKE
jgi:hypothetical protein